MFQKEKPLGFLKQPLFNQSMQHHRYENTVVDKRNTQASGVSKQFPSFLPSCHTAGSSLHGAHLWSTSFSHSKGHICTVQVSEAQGALKTIMQTTPQSHPARLVKACASSCLSCAARPSLAPLNPTATKRGTRYWGLIPRTSEHLGLCTGTQFSIVTFKALLKQTWKRISQDIADCLSQQAAPVPNFQYLLSAMS